MLPLRLWKRRAALNGNGSIEIEGNRMGSLAASLIRLMRPHHWVKNLLLLVPLLTSHRFTEGLAVSSELRAIVAMCLISSAVYIFNDFCDLNGDRMHRTKRYRPLANRDVSVPDALVLAGTVATLGALISAMLPLTFVFWVLVYFTVAVAYSLWLKRLPIIDVLALASLYVVRVLLGAAAIAAPLSNWLLLFSLALFASLALLKRYVELDDSVRRDTTIGPGRGYKLSDSRKIGRLGVLSACLSILVVVLYTNSAEAATYYADPGILLGLAPLLAFWLARAWFIVFRGEMHDDPIVYALRDPASYVVVTAMVGLTYLAL
jgi:4-hydroxybenzoate polyprenyltransferase